MLVVYAQIAECKYKNNNADNNVLHSFSRIRRRKKYHMCGFSIQLWYFKRLSKCFYVFVFYSCRAGTHNKLVYDLLRFFDHVILGFQPCLLMILVKFYFIFLSQSFPVYMPRIFTEPVSLMPRGMHFCFHGPSPTRILFSILSFPRRIFQNMLLLWKPFWY